MKMSSTLKYLAVATLSLGVAAGCATQQQAEQAPPPKAEQPKPAASSAAADAIAAAKKSVAEAKRLGNLWRDTEKYLKQAEKAAAAGKEDEAIRLANKAKTQADLAVKQYYYEKSIDRTLKVDVSSTISYTVVRGDSLWGIAGKSEIYGDPYQWPLIYKANADKIEDADLIFPGQQFDIDTAPGADEVAAAVRHAKTRGAWSLGVVEESDKAYLGR